jgi:SMI1-KNR4 cell-wall
MALDDLLAVMPAPGAPFEVPSADAWASIEQRIGATLPKDYKQFIEIYGSGQIAKFIWIFNPFSLNENLNLEKQIETQSQVLSELEGHGEKVPYKSFPVPGGVLPFGVTDNGDLMFWETIGDSSVWPVLINESRAPEWETFDMPMSKFLARILAGKLKPNIFPKNFPEGIPFFKSSHL